MSNNTPKLRIIAEWRDHFARYVYLLEEYVPERTVRILFFFKKTIPAHWKLRCQATPRKYDALAWAEHYGVPIEYPNK